MSEPRLEFYVGDDITLKGQFESDGEEQTPDAGSAKCTIYKKGTVLPLVDNVAASISGETVFYKLATTTIGEYIAYLTATFNSGADKRTGEIKFVVRLKGGIW
jgi:hypothetical protein